MFVRLKLKTSHKHICYFDQNNLHAFGRQWASPPDIFSHLLQILMLKCLHFFTVSDQYLIISESRYSWCAVSVFGFPLFMGVRKGAKWKFATTWKLGLRTINF